MISLFI